MTALAAVTAITFEDSVVMSEQMRRAQAALRITVDSSERAGALAKAALDLMRPDDDENPTVLSLIAASGEASADAIKSSAVALVVLIPQ